MNLPGFKREIFKLPKILRYLRIYKNYSNNFILLLFPSSPLQIFCNFLRFLLTKSTTHLPFPKSIHINREFSQVYLNTSKFIKFLNFIFNWFVIVFLILFILFIRKKENYRKIKDSKN